MKEFYFSAAHVFRKKMKARLTSNRSHSCVLKLLREERLEGTSFYNAYTKKGK
jgi:uncharacterized protein (UPF0332 family)